MNSARLALPIQIPRPGDRPETHAHLVELRRRASRLVELIDQGADVFDLTTCAENVYNVAAGLEASIVDPLPCELVTLHLAASVANIGVIENSS